MNAQHIQITLSDGSPNGVLDAEIIGGTVRVTVCPKDLALSKEQSNRFKGPGLYCLLGKEMGDDVIYIGESDNVSVRLAHHRYDPKKKFWQSTIVMTSKDGGLGKTLVLYLQNLLYNAVKDSNKIKLVKGQTPGKPAHSVIDKIYAEKFFDQIKIILPVLGFKFIAQETELFKSKTINLESKKSPLFVMSYADAKATAQQINGKFVVFKGSMARNTATPAIRDSSKQLRESLLRDGSIKVDRNSVFWIFVQDVAFSSPSAAAGVIGGTSLNGRLCWKIQGTDQTYADWEESQS